MSLPSQPRCVITGAASGFGRAIALELATRHAHLVLGDIDLPGCEETAARCTKAGAASVKAQRCDVSKLADVEALSAASPERVDLVVNNAGVSTGGRVGELSIEDWRWTLDVDLWGVIHGCHVFVPRMRAQNSGHLLNVASAAGLLSAPKMAAYNVAKAGVVALSETLAAELKGSKIGVTVLCPTFFKTNIAASGRFADSRTKASAEKLVNRGKDVESVVRAALRSIESGELYSIPMTDGRWLWRLKRLVPEQYGSIVARGMKYVE